MVGELVHQRSDHLHTRRGLGQIQSDIRHLQHLPIEIRTIEKNLCRFKNRIVSLERKRPGGLALRRNFRRANRSKKPIAATRSEVTEPISASMSELSISGSF